MAHTSVHGSSPLVLCTKSIGLVTSIERRTKCRISRVEFQELVNSRLVRSEVGAFARVVEVEKCNQSLFGLHWGRHGIECAFIKNCSCNIRFLCANIKKL